MGRRAVDAQPIALRAAPGTSAGGDAVVEPRILEPRRFLVDDDLRLGKGRQQLSFEDFGDAVGVAQRHRAIEFDVELDEAYARCFPGAQIVQAHDFRMRSHDGLDTGALGRR